MCVQVAGEPYLDPCRWHGNPVTVTVGVGQIAAAGSVKLTPASVLTVQIQDPRQAVSTKTKDGRNPELSAGVWDPTGFYYPAHAAGGPAPVLTYRLAIPRDTPLRLSIASHDLKLGDASAAPLAANASQQAFQHATGDPNPIPQNERTRVDHRIGGILLPAGAGAGAMVERPDGTIFYNGGNVGIGTTYPGFRVRVSAADERR